VLAGTGLTGGGVESAEQNLGSITWIPVRRETPEQT